MITVNLDSAQAERIYKLLDRSTLTWLSRMRIMRPEARLQRMFDLMQEQELMMFLENEIDRERTERNMVSLASEFEEDRAIAQRQRKMELQVKRTKAAKVFVKAR